MFIGESEEVIARVHRTGLDRVPERTKLPGLRTRRAEEKDLQAGVIALAKLLGYRVYHTFDSRRSEPGFPDLILIRGYRLVAIELKSTIGDLTEAQKEWLRAFDAVTQVDAIVVRPGPNLDLVEQFLEAR
jgi:hypothetical protein